MTKGIGVSTLMSQNGALYESEWGTARTTLVCATAAV
jgi:hypothetical protein